MDEVKLLAFIFGLRRKEARLKLIEVVDAHNEIDRLLREDTGQIEKEMEQYDKDHAEENAAAEAAATLRFKSDRGRGNPGYRRDRGCRGGSHPGAMTGC